METGLGHWDNCSPIVLAKFRSKSSVYIFDLFDHPPYLVARTPHFPDFPHTSLVFLVSTLLISPTSNY